MPSNPYTQLISYFYSKVGDTFTLSEIRLKWEHFADRHAKLSGLKKNVPNSLTKTLLLQGFLERKIMEGELEYIPAESPAKYNMYRKKRPTSSSSSVDKTNETDEISDNSGNKKPPTDGI